MKFSFTRKINLANIDRDLWPYETEDISVVDADSFEEAQQSVDRLVSERIGYYRAISETAKKNKAIKDAGTGGSPMTPPPSTTGIGTSRAGAPTPSAPANGGSMPEEFKV